jgi:hypothetical protein
MVRTVVNMYPSIVAVRIETVGWRHDFRWARNISLRGDGVLRENESIVAGIWPSIMFHD